jgi:FkbM family methyltransferase
MERFAIFLVQCALLLRLSVADDASCDGLGLDQTAEGQALLQSSKSHLSSTATASSMEADEQEPHAHSADSSPDKYLFKEGEHPILAHTAPLDDEGMFIVTGTCCDMEMELFMRKVTTSMKLEVCDEARFLDVVPTFANCQVGNKSFADLKQRLTAASAVQTCPMVAPQGKCAVMSNGCAKAAVNVTQRRRACTPRMERSSPKDECALPQGAAWCEVRLKGVQPYWMAVYDWSVKSCWLSKHVCQAGFWDNHDPLAFGSPGQMVDIGGNIGYFSIALASAGWNVTTFEPMAPNLAMINATLCRNPHLRSKVHVVPNGLGIKDQECDMVSPSNNLGDGHVQCGDAVASGFSTDPKKNSYIGKYDLVKVGHFSIRRLDQMLLTHAIGKVDFVKIDVEGYESQVIAGSGNFLTQYQPRLFKLEVWNSSFGFNGTYFLNQFSNAGYKFFSDPTCKASADAKKLILNGLWEGYACSGH